MEPDKEYFEIGPQNYFSDYIKCFWMYKNTDEDIQHTIFPNGCFEFFVIYENGSLISVLFSGLRTKPFNVFVQKGVTIHSIRFKLSASEFIFNRKICDLLDKTISLESTFWDIGNLGFLSFNEFVNIISENIFQTIQKLPAPNIEKINLLNTVYINNLRVKDIVEETGWSSRKINRYFTKQFGLPLITFLNILRVRSSFSEIKQGKLYPEQNYFDQSHFIKEVRKYTENTPKELSKNKDDRFLQLSINKDDYLWIKKR